MTPGTIVLLHSPLTTASAWGTLPASLDGHHVVVPEVADDDRPPYAGRYVARAALEITAAGVRPPVVLVAHGEAGPLLPPIGAAQRAAHRLVGGYVFVDAWLPAPPGTTRLDQVETHAPDLRDLLDAGGRYPDAEPPGDLALRPRGRDFFTEELPMPQDWPDAPCGYLRTSPAFDDQARQARLRSWAVTETEAGHYAAVADTRGTADALAALIAAL